MFDFLVLTIEQSDEKKKNQNDSEELYNLSHNSEENENENEQEHEKEHDSDELNYDPDQVFSEYIESQVLHRPNELVKTKTVRRFSATDLKENNYNVLVNQAKLENSENFQNILQITDESIDNDKKNFCLTFEAGINCKTLMNSIETLNLKERLMMALDIALGLKAMHSCNIIHTNIKLDNVIKAQES